MPMYPKIKKPRGRKKGLNDPIRGGGRSSDMGKNKKGELLAKWRGLAGIWKMIHVR